MLLVLSLSSGCLSRTSSGNQSEIDAANIAANDGKPPTMFLGIKLYPHAAMKIATTPMILTPTCSSHRSSGTYINTTTIVKSSNGSTTTYTTKGYIR